MTRSRMPEEDSPIAAAARSAPRSANVSAPSQACWDFRRFCSLSGSRLASAMCCEIAYVRACNPELGCNPCSVAHKSLRLECLYLQMASKKFKYEGRLVALLWDVRGAYYFARGDREKRRVSIKPVEEPFLYLAPAEMSFSEQLREFAKHNPPHNADAFVQRISFRELMSREAYHIAVQYYRISQRNWRRAYNLAQLDKMLKQELYPTLNLPRTSRNH